MFIGNMELLKLAASLMNDFIHEEADRMEMRAHNGIEWLGQEHKKLVGKTPNVVIFRKGKLKVRRYLPLRDHKAPMLGEPILMIPPLGVKPYVFDLLPEYSLAEGLLQAGIHLYVVDFGEPELGDNMTLERYVTEWLPMAVDAVRKWERRQDITLLGYCMGGLFSLMCTAWAEDEKVKKLIIVGAPFDMHVFLPGSLAGRLDALTHSINKTAEVLGSYSEFRSAWIKWGWRIVNPKVTATKYVYLMRNLWNHDFIRHFRALQQWSEDFVNFPVSIVPKLYKEIAVKNALRNDNLELAGKITRISWITCPLLVFAGERDIFGLPASVKALMDVASSVDKKFFLARGGHLGVICGKYAREDVWQEIIEWLSARSSKSISRAM